MKRILNLTGNPSTVEQRADGVFDIKNPDDLAEVKDLLTIHFRDELTYKAAMLANLAQSYDVKYAMIDCAPCLVSHLERYLKNVGIEPVYAFSEERKHKGWYMSEGVFIHSGFKVDLYC